MINKSKSVTLRAPLKNYLRGSAKRGRRVIGFFFDKRQKFIIGIAASSLCLFITELRFNRSGIYIAAVLPFFTSFFLYWAIRKDLAENRAYQVFILPFFYSLA